MVGEEIARLIVRLMGDSSNYEQMWKDSTDTAEQGTEEIKKTVGNTAKETSKLVKAWEDFNKENDITADQLKMVAIGSAAVSAATGVGAALWSVYAEETAKAALASLGMSDFLAGFIAFIPTFILGLTSAISGLVALTTAAWASVPALISATTATWGMVVAVYALIAPLLPLIIAVTAIIALLAGITYALVVWYRESTKAAREAEALQEEVDKLTQKYQEQLEALGKTNEEYEIYKLRKKGATQAQLEEAIALQAIIKEYKEEMKAIEDAEKALKKHNEEVKEAIKAAALRIATVGQEKEIVEATKRILEGWSQEEVKVALGLELRAKALEEANKKQKEHNKTIAEFITKSERELEGLSLTGAALALHNANLGSLTTTQRQHILATLEGIEAGKRAAKAAEETKKELEGNQKAVEDMIKALVDEVNTLGMSARAKALYAAVAKGAGDAEIEIINNLYDSIEAFKENEKATKDRNKVLKEGQKVIESLLTPMEKYNKAVADLEKLRNVGAIDDTTLRRGIAKAQEELNKADLKTKIKVRVEFEDNEAVRAGTKEFRELLAKVGVPQLGDVKVRPDILPGFHNAPAAMRPQQAPIHPAKGEDNNRRILELLDRIATATESINNSEGLELVTLENA